MGHPVYVSISMAATSSCYDNRYNVNYNLPMWEQCGKKMVNDTEVQLIPKLIRRNVPLRDCSERNGIPAGYRICRIPRKFYFEIHTRTQHPHALPYAQILTEYTYMYTMHTYIHTNIHSYIHTYIHTCMHNISYLHWCKLDTCTFYCLILYPLAHLQYAY